MNTIWTFGDSFTFGYACNELCTTQKRLEYLPYKKEDDDIWPNLLGKLLNYNVKNFGKNGASNDYIFNTLIDNFNNINEGDIVLINMTFHGRIEVPVEDEILNIFFNDRANNNIINRELIKKSLLPIVEDGSIDTVDEIYKTIVNFQYYFMNNPYYKKKNIKKFEFLQERLLNEKKIKFCYIWGLEENKDILNGFERIHQHTSNKINDEHFSFNGHREFSKFIYSLITNKNKLL
jgi:hypothetical protein